MADTAIPLDAAPEVDLTSDLEAEAGTEEQGAPSGEQPTGEPTGEPTGQPGEKPAAPVNEPSIVGNRLSTSAYKALNELKRTNPRLAAEAKAALFDSHQLREAFPGGLREVQALRDQLNELGGLQSIQSVRDEVAYFNDLDQQFTAGDPRFLQAMLDTPEGQQGFIKLAPLILDKYREMAPEHFDTQFAKQEMQDMAAARVDLTLYRMLDIINEMKQKPELAPIADRLTEQFNSLGQYYNAVAERAAKKAELPSFVKAAPSGENDERQQFEREKRELNMEKWARSTHPGRLQFFNSELARRTKDAPLTDTQMATFRELYGNRINKAMEDEPGYKEAVERFFANGDLEGFKRHVLSTYRTVAPRIMRVALDMTRSGRGVVAKPKAGVATPGASARPATATGAKPAEGFKWVNAMPDKNKIAFGPGRTTGAMIREGRAILEDGSRVQWRTGV
jgi:hypothetical protein